MLTMTLPRKRVVRFGPDDFGAEVDGQIIGSADSYDAAQTLADQRIYTLLTTEQALRDDPCIPFGTAGGPNADDPCDLSYLDHAQSLLATPYADSEAVQRRLASAIQIVQQPTTWRITATGDLQVQGSSTRPYRVNDAHCTCKDYWMRQGDHGGLCKHMLAREVLRLVQVLAAANPAQALAEVPGPSLMGLLGFVRLACELAAASITLTIADGALTVVMGDYTAAVPLRFADGAATFTLTPEQFADQLWPTLKRHPIAAMPSLTLLIEQHTLDLTCSDFTCTITH